ncbi:AAA family ATPase [Cystobacter fuscus]
MGVAGGSSAFVVATQNPLEFEGTYPLPEAQLDRFLMRVRVGDPPPEAELDMVRAFHQQQGRPPQVERMPDAPTLLELQARAPGVAARVEQRFMPRWKHGPSSSGGGVLEAADAFGVGCRHAAGPGIVRVHSLLRG